jgi:integrase
MTAFVREHMAKGYKAEELQSRLRLFDNYLVRVGHKNLYIVKSDYDKWLDSRCEIRQTTLYKEIGIILRFLIYMCKLGHECYIPRLPKKPHSNFVPYIYSKEDMEKIFKIADSLRLKVRFKGSIMIVIPVLLRFLYSTGCRIGEALAIKNRDLDFNRHTAILNETKNGCQRLLPINPSLDVVLKQYIYHRNMMPVKGVDDPDSPLFVSGRGTSPAQCTIYEYLQRIIKKADILYKGNHEGPNIHGIRHTACVHAMADMVHEGKDIYCALPILSAFMGHKNMEDTETYIHLTQEIYPDLLGMDKSIMSGINNVIARAIINNN